MVQVKPETEERHYDAIYNSVKKSGFPSKTVGYVLKIQ